MINHLLSYEVRVWRNPTTPFLRNEPWRNPTTPFLRNEPVTYGFKANR